jgi:hypothetical protein
MNIFTKIIKILFAPIQAIPELKGADWLLPFILTIVVATATTIAIYPTVLEPIAEQHLDKQMEKMPADQQRNMAMAKQQLKNPTVQMVQSIVGGVFQGVGILIVALAVMAMGALMGGRSVKFTVIFPIISWASLVGVIENLIKLPLMLAKESPFVSFSPAAFLDIEAMGGPIYSALSQINPFALWWVAIVSAGLTHHLGFTRRKSVIVLLVLGTIWAFLSMLGAAIGLNAGG